MIIVMTYKFPNWPPVFWDMPENFTEIRNEYITTNEIIDISSVENENEKTVVVTTIFKDAETFEKWKAEPAVESFFNYRNDYCKNNGIEKTAEFL
jgi:hypothetical protein